MTGGSYVRPATTHPPPTTTKTTHRPPELIVILRQLHPLPHVRPDHTDKREAGAGGDVGGGEGVLLCFLFCGGFLVVVVVVSGWVLKVGWMGR